MKKRFLTVLVSLCLMLSLVPVSSVTTFAAGLGISSTYAKLATKSTLQLTATRQDTVWSTSNPAVATVDENGLVTAVSYGTADITASYGTAKAVCRVETYFYDVSDSSKYYYDAVYWAAEKEITKGYNGVYFGPENDCTRRELMIFLWRMAGKPEVSGTMAFNDMSAYKSSSDTYKAVLWGISEGIVKGYSDGGFHPNAAVTRKDTMIMLYRFAGKPDVSGEITFADVLEKGYEPSSDTYKAILWGTQKGITKGYADGSFKPLEDCLREHTVTFLYRYSRLESQSAFGGMAAAAYTYVNSTPSVEAGSGNAQVQFIYGQKENNVVWAADIDGEVKSGSFTATGDVFNFFEELYIADRPLYDWLASNSRSTEGYEGNLDGNCILTIDENGLLSGIRANDGTCNIVAVITKDIVAPDLVVSGATRGQPNLLQSSVTLSGSANCVEITGQGNQILNELTLYGNEEGVGLKASKIGGDVFVVGTLYVDAEVQWYSRYGNIQTIQAGTEATIETNGQTIDMRGANIGRMRALNLKSNGGDIIIGTEVSNDYGRNKLLADQSTGTLSFSNTGTIDAGTGNVIIGTNTYRVVSLDIVGDIIANDVTIKPTDNGTVADVLTSIGNITATGNVDIVIGSVNASNSAADVIGDITAGGNVSLTTGIVNGSIGSITAQGDVKVVSEGCRNADTLESTVTGATVSVEVGNGYGSNLVDAVPFDGTIYLRGEDAGFNAYTIDGDVYFDVRDLIYKLDGTPLESYISWTGAQSGTLTINTNQDYATSNLKDYTPMAAKGTETVKAAALSVNAVYIDLVQYKPSSYIVDEKTIMFSVEEIANDMGLTVELIGGDIYIGLPGEKAAGNDNFGLMPAGAYTYVDETPVAEAGSGTAQVQFLWGVAEDNIVYAIDVDGEVITGTETASGAVLDFFNEVYLSDVPVTDWLQGSPKDTEGYAGEVAGNLVITITAEGKISNLSVTSPATRVTTVLTKDLVDDLLTVSGSTRSKPFLQSCITMVGEVNGLSLVKQGDVILDELVIGHDSDGVGLYGSKIGGDTFVSGKVVIDGTIKWNSKMGVITALESEPGIIETLGYDIEINGGSNTGRAQRDLSIYSNGGDIKIGTAVTTDQTRGGIIKNPTSPNILTISTKGVIDAGTGDVIIGTDDRETVGVEIDRLGTVKGNNITIKPINYGTVGNVVTALGNIEAEGNVDIEVGIVNTGGVVTSSFSSSDGTVEKITVVDPSNIDKSGIVIGDITSANGNITLKAGKVYGLVGEFSAPNGSVTAVYEQVTD